MQRSGIPPILYIVVALAIIPLNFALFQGLAQDTIESRLPDWILFSVLALGQLAAGVAAGVSGIRRWRSKRSAFALLLAIAGWMLALAAVVGWAGGFVLATMTFNLRM